MRWCSAGTRKTSDEYRFHGLPKAMGLWMARLVHFIMQRKQLVELARRAEGGRAEGARHERAATG